MSAAVFFDGSELFTAEKPGARKLKVDSRCLEGEGVMAFAHICALADPDAALRFDEPEVQQVRRDAFAWWIPMLGNSLVCLTMLALDGSRCAGAITVARDPSQFGNDPFARLFPGTVLETDVFSPVAPPAGPVIERYAGVPWPGGRF